MKYIPQIVYVAYFCFLLKYDPKPNINAEIKGKKAPILSPLNVPFWTSSEEWINQIGMTISDILKNKCKSSLKYLRLGRGSIKKGNK